MTPQMYRFIFLDIAMAYAVAYARRGFAVLIHLEPETDRPHVLEIFS